jgi:hypothetical protein
MMPSCETKGWLIRDACPHVGQIPSREIREDAAPPSDVPDGLTNINRSEIAASLKIRRQSPSMVHERGI